MKNKIRPPTEIEIEQAVLSGVCPICYKDLIIRNNIERHDDNIAHNQTITTYICSEHGDINEM